jgi:predicted alpha/beta hydrolase family esterase
MTREATVLIVPGLRDHVPEHWQTLLASRLPRVRGVTPIGRDKLDRLARVEAIEEAAASIDGAIIIVAHSGGVIAVTHWARLTRRAVRGALLPRRQDRSRKGTPPGGSGGGGRLAGAAQRSTPRAGRFRSSGATVLMP